MLYKLDAIQVVNLGKKGYYKILCFESSDVPDRRIVVPQHLRQQVLDENHNAIFAGHFQLNIGNVHLVLYVPLFRANVDNSCHQ